MFKKVSALVLLLLGFCGLASAQITISGSYTVLSKTYDGTTNASINQNNLVLNGVANGDQVSIGTVNLAFDSKTVGVNKIVRISSITLSGANAGSYTVSYANAPSSSATITQKELQITGSATVSNKEYDATTSASLVNSTGLSLLGKVGSDLVALSNLSVQFEDASVGTGKAVSLSTASITGNDAGNYILTIPTSPIALANITTKQLTIVGTFTVAGKVYDGLTSATISDFSSLSLFGVLNNENVSIISPKAVYSNKTAGNGKAVQLTEAYLSGNDAGNYTVSVSGAPLSTADISKKQLTVGGTLRISNKTYDATTTATISNIASLTLVGRVSTDQVTITQPSSTFSNKNVGTNKTVTLISMVLAGTDAANYTFTLNNAPTGSASITAKSLSLNGTFDASDKVYDGNRTATILVNGLSLDGVEAGDDATMSTLQSQFDTSLPGVGKQVALTSVSLAGIDGSNYSINLSTAPKTTADITVKELSISGSFTVVNKTYDGTQNASILNSSLLTLSGAISGDQVSLTGLSAQFVTKDAGTSKSAVITAASITGANADRYTLTIVGAPTATAVISQKELTVSGSFTTANKVYDALKTATVTDFSQLQLNGIIGADNVAIFQIQAEFNSKNVGVGKEVSISSSSLTGSESGNYTVNLTGSSTSIATITAKSTSLTGSFTISEKEYDGNISASISVNALSLNGILSGDVVGFASITTNFVTATPGTGKLVSISAVSLNGVDAQNYSLSLVGAPTNTGTISSKALTLSGSFTAANKSYDGTDNATIVNTALLNVNGIVGAEDVDFTGLTAKFENKNIGANKTVSLISGALNGVDAANYRLDLSSAPTTTASITGDVLTVIGSFLVNAKVYDGTKTAERITDNLQLSGVNVGDVVSLGTISIEFDDAFPGQNKSVTIKSISLSGADAGNYTLDLTGAPSSSSEIYRKELSMSGFFTVFDKMYDGTKAAQLNNSSGLSLVGVVGSDAVSLTVSNAEFESITVANSKTVTITSASLLGTNAGNYQLSYTNAPSTSANILSKELSIGGSFTITDKLYDGTASASINDASLLVLNGVVGADVVSLSNLSAEFDSKSVGNSKTIQLINANLDGANAANYSLSLTNAPETLGAITPKTVSLSGNFSVSDKSYDGTTVASVTSNFISLNGLLAGDDATLANLLVTFDTKTPGNAKLVTIQSAELFGNDANNYSLSTAASPTTTASIFHKELTVEGDFSISDKEYDGTVNASISDLTLLELIGIVSGEQVGIESITAHFADKTIGVDKEVNLQEIILNGSDSLNYSLNIANAPTTNATISAKQLTLTGSFVVADRSYDATTVASISSSSLAINGIVLGDDVSLGQTEAAFDSKSTGALKSVSLTSVSLSGANAANYTTDLVTAPTTTANIFPKAITATGVFSVSNKEYDAQKTAIVSDSTLLVLNGVISGESVTLSYLKAEFVDATVSNSKTVQLIDAKLIGADSLNYSLSINTVSTTTASITPKNLTLSGSFTVFEKQYDGTVVAAILDTPTQLVLNGIVNAEDVSLNENTLLVEFETKTAGENKTVQIKSGSLLGANKDNYLLNLTNAPTSSATIKPYDLRITGIIKASDKVYDGTNAVTITESQLSLFGLVAGDNVSTGVVTYEFSSVSPQVDIQVNISSLTITGSDASNYTVNLTDSPFTTATISPKSLTLSGSFTADSKIYDGLTDANISDVSLLLLNGVINGEVVSLDSIKAAFTAKSIGIGKAVRINSAQLVGSDSANYALNLTGSPISIADISPKAIEIKGAFTVSDKIYDGTMNANILDQSSLIIEGSIVTDDVGFTEPRASFVDKKVGANKTVNLSGAVLTGADAQNYTFTSNAQTTASISQREVTLGGSFLASNKIYDGLVTASIQLDQLVLNNKIASDTVNIATIDVEFDQSSVGATIPVTVKNVILSGVDATNYSLNLTSSPSTTASINSKFLQLTGAFTVDDKIYDGNTKAVISNDQLELVGLVVGETVEIDTVSAVFASKNIGTDISVSLDFARIKGAQSPNYSITVEDSPLTSASITTKELQIVNTLAADKVYDASIIATLVQIGELDGLVGTETILLNAPTNVVYTDRNAGNDKQVKAYDYTISDGSNGGLAQNYSLLADSTETTATISKAPLNVIANNHVIIVNDIAYSGGNGVTYQGFVGNEDETFLTGTLAYSGTAQGATLPGTYTITPEGLNSNNYEISFKDGSLTIQDIPYGTNPIPAAGATKISLSTEISLAFTVDVTSGSAINKVKILSGADETPLTSVSAKIENNRLVLSHPALENFSDYTVEIPSGAVISVNNVPNDAFTWSFTTIRSTPIVRITNPLPDVRAVPLQESLTIKFDQNINAKNLDLVKITNSQNIRLSNVVATLTDSVTVTIAHPDFDHSTTYTVTLPENAVQNLDAVSNAEYVWSFRTILTPPTVVSLLPSAGATRIAVDANVNLTFNQDISVVDLSKVRIQNDKGELVPNLNVFLINKSITIGHPSFTNNTIYTVIVPNGTVSNTDKIVNDSLAWNFRTIKTQPVFSSVSPRNGAAAVALDTVISITFDQKISLASNSGITIRDEANKLVGSLLTTLVDSTLQISHASFGNNKTYTVTIAANVVRNEDLLGNQGLSWSFKTIRSKPEALKLVPDNRTVNISREPDIRITFNQDVDLINAGGVTMRETGGVIVDGLSAEMATDSTISINVPTLKYSTEYTVSIAQSTVQNQDLLINDGISWTFTTIVEPPQKPVLSLPEANDLFVDQKPIFKWRRSSRAASYDIEISLSPVFDVIVTSKTGITDTSFTFQLNPLTNYSWRVRAINVGGTSEWSDVSSFTTKALTPALSFPTANQKNVSTAPFLSWSGANDVLNHQIQVSTNAQFTTNAKDTISQGLTVQIPGLAAKRQYFWRVRVNDDVGRSEWSLARSFSTRTNPDETENKTVAKSISFAPMIGNATRVPIQSDYKLLSMPGSETIPLVDFFTEPYMENWRAFYETGSSDENNYLTEYNPTDSSMAFSPGLGYWVISKTELTIRRGFSSVTPNSKDSYAIPLNTGWNIISNPYQTDVDWELTQQINDIVADLYDFDNAYTKVTVMNAFKGYYFYNDPNFGLETLLIPYSSASQVGLQVMSVRQDLGDIPNLKLMAKHSDGSQNEVDLVFDTEHDFAQPLLLAKSLSTSSGNSDQDEFISEPVLERVHPRLGFAKHGMVIKSQENTALAYDRKLGGSLEQESYILELKANRGSVVQLSTELNQLADDNQVLLVNKLTKVMTSISKNETVSLKITEPLSSFDVYVGSTSYLDEIKSQLLPESFTLEQNYPNPFNPTTVIRYSLSESASVRLEVFDILGRKVQTLVNTKQQAGWYTFDFNGTNLASGVYLYRLQAGNFVKIQKMTLVK